MTNTQLISSKARELNEMLTDLRKAKTEGLKMNNSKGNLWYKRSE